MSSGAATFSRRGGQRSRGTWESRCGRSSGCRRERATICCCAPCTTWPSSPFVRVEKEERIRFKRRREQWNRRRCRSHDDFKSEISEFKSKISDVRFPIDGVSPMKVVELLEQRRQNWNELER